MKTLNRIFMGLVATIVVASGANNRQSIKKELVSSSFSSGVTTLNWVIKYDTNTTSPLKDVVIKDTYSSAQTYTPNTEAHPNGWSVTQNPSGFTWEIGDGLGYSKPFPKPFKPVTAGSATGDGYAPIPYTSLSGAKRIYYLNHHATQTDLIFGCIGDCSNSVTWPMKLPDGDPNSPATSGTSAAPETVVLNRKLYYPVSRPTDAGIGCFDLETSTECGYLQLAPYSSNSSERSVIDGLSLVGSNTLVIMDKAGKIYKVSVASNGNMSLNTSYDATTVGMRTDFSPHAQNGKYYGIGSQINGDKVYFVKGHLNPSNNRIMCYDSTANSICSGWGSAKSSTSIWSSAPNTYLYYNTSMNPTAICLSQSNSKNWAQQCFSLTTGSVVSYPDILLAGSTKQVKYTTGFEATKGTKTYFPSASMDSVFCHDWTGATCPRPIIYRQNSENLTSKTTKNYGVAEDSEGCMWVYSHKNKLWSFDPKTGAVPCIGNDLVLEDTYDASKNWCASKDVKWSYNQFKITGITSGEFSDLNVTFYDANGAVISTQSIPTNGVSYSKGLSTGVFASNIPIHYKIEGTRTGSSNGHDTTPIVTISVDGPPREFCFQTTIPCPITGEVYNNATVGLKDAPAIDDRDEVVLDGELVCKDTQPEPPKQCLNVEPKLTCSKAGWKVELNSFTPANYSASNTEISVLAPSGVEVKKWGSKWYLNGANAGDTVRLNMHGVDVGAGNFKDGDLCCDGEANITIPQDQTCEPSNPEINATKSYADGKFKLHIDITGEVNTPQILTIIDRVPTGITVTGIDSSSATNWACSNSFPVSGSANLVCGYIGSMPVSGSQDLILNATIDSKESVTNCMDAGIIQSDGTSIVIDDTAKDCVTIEHNQEDNDTEDNNTGCETDADCPAGYCHQGMCIVPEDGNNTGGGTDDNGTTGADVPLTCSSNIIIVADESGSIAEANAISNVQDAIRNLAKGYKGSGSKAAVIHFSNNAQLVKPMTTIETAGGAPNQENLFTTGYNPTVGQTNWEAGLKEALNQVNSNPGPEIVFFITDGQPNKYLDANGNVQSGSEAQSVAEAVAVANQINSSGGRIVAIGVGDISSSATAQSNLNQIASSSDDAIVGQTSDLNAIIGEYVTKSCSDILLRKSINYTSINLHSQDINSIKPIVTLTVTNSSPSNMTNIVVEDALPAPKMTYNSTVSQSVGTVSSVPSNKVRWTIPILAPNATATAKFKVNLSAVAGDKIKNYAQVVSLDQSVASTPNNLANPVTGPLNLSDKDEGYTETRIYDHNTTGGSGCNPATAEDKCLTVTKRMKSIEGNCMPGHQCVYDVSIRNYSAILYTGNIHIVDNMVPASLGANITITANGTAPTPMCSPTPTAIPFSCMQSTDLPANTTWSYTVTMSSVPQGADKNCFKAGASNEQCFNFPSSDKSEPKPDIPVIIKPNKPDIKPIIDKPKPVDDKPKPLIVVPRGNLSLYKRGPKVCKAGGICTFTLTVKNRGRGTYTGPATVQDKSREFRGKLIRTRGKGWRCRTTRGGYVCNNPKLRLRAGASSQIKLSIRIPKRAKGYLTNCAKLDVLQGSNRVRAIQTMLLAAGYNTGGVNGSMNKKTIRALKAYARASGLKGKKAQSVAIKRLLAKYPFIRSKNSCVKVKIKESKPDCRKGQHFNGKQCVTCPRGSYWDKRRKRCVLKDVIKRCPRGTYWDKRHNKCKPKRDEGVKTCPRGYVFYKNRCYKEQRRAECPRGQVIDKRTGTCKRKLDAGTVLNIINVVGHIIGGGGGDKPDREPPHKGGI